MCWSCNSFNKGFSGYSFYSKQNSNISHSMSLKQYALNHKTMSEILFYIAIMVND